MLLVEDEAGLRLTLSDRLGSEGYAVETASDGEAGLARAATGGYDLIVLDVMLPRMNGFDVCREVRQRGVTTPILMLTARGQVVDKVVGLKLGADDYLTKPFETIELMARLEALLRRAPSSADRGGDAYRFGDVVVDFRKMEVDARRRAGRAVGARVQAAASLHRASRRDAVARRAAGRRVGLRRDAADADRRCARRRPAAEDRSQPQGPRVHPHRPRSRLQVRRLSLSHRGLRGSTSEVQSRGRSQRSTSEVQPLRPVVPGQPLAPQLPESAQSRARWSRECRF